MYLYLDHSMATETILSIFLGIGLAASVGFRVFLPLFALSLASYFGVWDLNENWQWIGSLVAVLTLGLATLLEIFAYFIPWFDNLLDSGKSCLCNYQNRYSDGSNSSIYFCADISCDTGHHYLGNNF